MLPEQTSSSVDDATSSRGSAHYSPGSAERAGRIADQIRAWDRDHQSGTGPRIEAYPAGTDPPAHEPVCLRQTVHPLAISWLGKMSGEDGGMPLRVPVQLHDQGPH
jgi:hypothetical protein